MDGFSEARAFGVPTSPRVRLRTRTPLPPPPNVTMSVSSPHNVRADEATNSRFSLRFETAAEVMAAPERSWLVPAVIPSGGFAALFGPSGSGKSFLALDLALALATGGEWFGHTLRQTPVIYLCLEGGDGFGNRIRAWLIRHGLSRIPDTLKFMRDSFRLQFRQHRDAVAEAMHDCGAPGGLVVIDTLSRAYGEADENSGSDMSLIVHACNALQKDAQVAVLLVHHTGKDSSKGLRGHSSLRASLDTAIEVRATKAHREWLVSKNKDGAEGQRHRFALAGVTVGTDSNGEPITSCAISAAHIDGESGDSQPVLRGQERPQGKHQETAAIVLTRLFTSSADSGLGGAPESARCVSLAQAVNEIAPVLACADGRRNEYARSAINRLIAKGVYGMQGGWLWEKFAIR